MIKVTVELVSGIHSSRNRKLAEMTITNDGTGNQQIGNYIAVLHAEYTPPAGRKCRIEGFNRQMQSVASLIGAALKFFGHTRHSPKLIRGL